jgi:hypothetical protein
MPTFEVHFLTDRSKGWPDGWMELPQVETNRTVDAVGPEQGIYRVREVDGDPVLWRRNPDGTTEIIDAI